MAHPLVDQILSEKEQVALLERKLEAIADFNKHLQNARWVPPRSYYKKGWMNEVADRLLTAGPVVFPMRSVRSCASCSMD